jgi:hypothetical protein
VAFNFNFLKDLNTEKKVAGKAFGFLSNAVPGVQQRAMIDAKSKEIREQIDRLPAEAQQRLQPQQRMVDEAAKKAPNTAESIRDFVIGSARGTLRVPETLFRSSAQAGTDIGAKINGANRMDLNQTGENKGIRGFLYGEEPLQTYQKRQEGYKKSLEEGTFTGAGVIGHQDTAKQFATPLSLLAVGATASSDVVGGKKPKVGKEAAAAASVAEQSRSMKFLAPAGEEGMRQRGLLRTTQNADSIPEESRQAISTIEPQAYEQMSIDDTLQQARQRVSTNFDEAKRLVDDSFTNNTWTPESSSLTRALVEKAAAEGNHELVKELMEKAAPLGTTSGQANVLWRGMSSAYDPEGMVKFAQRVVDDANQNRGGLTKLFSKEEYTLDDTTKDFIRTEMGRALRLPDGQEKDDIMRGIMDKVNDRIPPGASEMFDAYRYQNLLSNPRTQLRNTASNLFQTMITRPATLAARASTDWFGATLFGKDRQYYAREVPEYYKGLFNSVGDAVEASKMAWRGELPISNPDLSDVRALRNQKIPKALTVVSRAMEAQDRFFSSLISAGEYAAQKAKGIDDVTALKEANKVAEYSLFRAALDPTNKTGQGQILSSIDKLSETVTKFGAKHKAFRWFVPFIRTPMNVTKQMVEYSPLGFANIPSATNKTEEVSKAMAGTTLTLIGAKLALDGNTTWDAPKDETERKLFYESGKRPYSIKVGDKWVPMIYLGPYALAFALPAAAKSANDNAPIDAGTAERMGAAIQNSLKFFSQQTYVQGIANVVDLVSGQSGQGATNPSSALGFTAGQALPLQGLQRYVSGVFDPTFRKSEGFLDSIQRDSVFLPGAGFIPSRQLEAHTSLSGEESKRNATDYLAPYTLGLPSGSAEDRSSRAANADFLKTLRKTSRSRTKANTEINEAIAERDYTKARRIAESYNDQLRAAFKGWNKTHNDSATNPLLVKRYNSQKIRLTASSIAQRRYSQRTKSKYERSLSNA